MIEIKEVFHIRGRDLVAVCRQSKHVVVVGADVEVVKEDGTVLTAMISGVERFDHMTTVSPSLGIYLRGVQKGDVVPGDVIRFE
jgi:translation elongation factor EF-Tu-like GTPase